MTEVKTKPDAKGEGRLQGSDRFHDVRFGGREWAADFMAQKLNDPGVYEEANGPNVLDLTVSVGQTAAVYERFGFHVLGVDRDKDATKARFHMKAERFLDKLGEDKLPSVRCVDFEPYGLVAVAPVWFALLDNLHKFNVPLLVVSGCNPRIPVTRNRHVIDWGYHWGTTKDEAVQAFRDGTLWKVWAAGMAGQAERKGLKYKLLHEIHDEQQRKVVLVGLLGVV